MVEPGIRSLVSSRGAADLPAGIKCPFLQSSMEMQNAYYSMFESLKAIKEQYDHGGKSVSPSLFRFLW